MSNEKKTDGNLLSFGYCREIQQQLSMDIPEEIMNMISFYNTKYIIVAAGKNGSGQLSTGNGRYVESWGRMKKLEDITCSYLNIYLNYESICVIDAYHNVYVSGNNTHCRLGRKMNDDDDEYNDNINSLEKITFKSPSLLCSTGISNSMHTFILSVNHELYVNGKNEDGQFGNGNIRDLNEDIDELPFSPPDSGEVLLKIEPFWNKNESIKMIQCGRCHTVFLTTNRNVYGCGDKMSIEPHYILVDDDENHDKSILTPKLLYHNILDMAVGRLYTIFINTNHDLLILGNEGVAESNVAKHICQYFVNNKLKIKKIASGARHILVLCMNNRCYSVGNNNYGQSGQPHDNPVAYWDSDDQTTFIDSPYLLNIGDDNDEYIEQISCGYDHSLVLSNKNNVYSFGDNAFHQCSCIDIDVTISKPHYLDKVKELKLDAKAYIDLVMAFTEESIIIINPNKSVRV